jgi:chaperonin cofactor prefoldin
MSKKLTKEELEKKLKFYEKKVVYYEKKIEAIDKQKHRIGFRHYD